MNQLSSATCASPAPIERCKRGIIATLLSTGISYGKPGARTLLVWLVSSLLLWISPGARAQQFCSIQSQPSVLSFGQIDTARDAPIGTVISNSRTVSVTVRCPPSNGRGFRAVVYPTRTVSRAVRGVWQTNIPGIGIRARNSADGITLSQVSPGTPPDDISRGIGPTIRPARYTNSRTYTITHQLVKTGPIDVSGQINIGTLYTLRIYNLTRRVTSEARGSVSIGRNTVVTSRSCRVTTPGVTVALTDALASALQNNGASTGSSGFAIGLQCDTNTNVFITLTDATTPGNRSDLLTLANGSTARNVRLRVRKQDGTAVNFGPDSAAVGNANQWRLGQVSGATLIPMSVEYVSSGRATAGTVRAVATFTMSYQ
ncbi:fimbrial protein [Cupriavidus sp. D384]|uniref:fimbrial protein n=1 Tax=Cupriavidus sp. D384 TaxID=1538095 RepID=UPI00082B2CD2|nr:fimbrial protein [Cupriavidus sp. D384]